MLSISSSAIYSAYDQKTFEDFKKRYRVGKIIGEGSFSKVKEGLDLQNSKKVAIKEISKDFSDDLSLENEVQILKILDSHENIISLLDVYDSEKVLYLITDYAEKGELFDWIIAKGELSEYSASQIMKHACQGLKYLHDHNIIHLDIKPENLLLTEDMTLKLADFGLAIKLPGPEFHYVRTECVGTPAYWAPELVKNESFGKGVDVWALGCVLYIILCGSHPFDPYGDSSESEILGKVVKGEYDIESPTYELLSPQAKDLISHMLDPNSSRRYTIDQVMKHPWLSSNEQILSSKPLPLDHMAKLKAFRALQLMRLGISFNSADCALMFSSFDKNNDGVLSRKELKQALKKVGISFNTKEMNELFLIFNNNKNKDFIEIEEFKNTLLKTTRTRKENKLQHIKYLFDTFDKNKDGYIDREDCIHLMDSLGVPQNKTKLFRKIHRYKTNKKSDLIDFTDFVKFFRKMELEAHEQHDLGILKKRTIKTQRKVTVRTRSGGSTKTLVQGKQQQM